MFILIQNDRLFWLLKSFCFFSEFDWIIRLIIIRDIVDIILMIKLSSRLSRLSSLLLVQLNKDVAGFIILLSINFFHFLVQILLFLDCIRSCLSEESFPILMIFLLNLGINLYEIEVTLHTFMHSIDTSSIIWKWNIIVIIIVIVYNGTGLNHLNVEFICTSLLGLLLMTNKLAMRLRLSLMFIVAIRRLTAWRFLLLVITRGLVSCLKVCS